MNTEEPHNFAPHIEEADDRRAWNLEEISMDSSPRLRTFDSPVPIHGAEASLPSPSELRNSAFSVARSPEAHNSILSHRRRGPRWIQLGIAVGVVFCTLLVGAIVLSRSNDTPTKGMKHVVAYVESQGISAASDLNNHNSPQYKAAQWLANVDDAVVPDESIHHHDGYRFMTRYILALLYFELGENSWRFNLDFMSPLDICDWNGVVIDNPQNVMKAGMYCDAIGNLPIYLRMKLALLTTLRSLELEGNELEGKIPTELCQLENLHSLFLGQNRLTGTIPDCIDNIDSLAHLSVNDNFLEDELPSGLGNIFSLRQLYVDDNQFTGDPTKLFDRLQNLEILMANDNDFSGTLHNDFLASHNSLAWIDLSGNKFSSPLNVGFPVHLLSLKNLEVIDLSRNSLVGKFPNEIDLNFHMKFLSVYGNQLTGQLPTQITNLRGLHHLDLSDNLFSGPILSSLGQLANLRALFLGGNPDFDAGGVPTAFETLINLEDLSLRKTNRKGPLPMLHSLKNLVLLDLGSNDFTGEIPETYGDFVDMEFLMLNHNHNITGSLPQVMEKLTELRAIFLDGTSITGNVEEVVCELPNFSDMDGHQVAYADCKDNIPCKCCQCCIDGCSVPFQLNLRNSWVKDFQKLGFTFSNNTAFINRDYIPPIQDNNN